MLSPFVLGLGTRAFLSPKDTSKETCQRLGAVKSTVVVHALLPVPNDVPEPLFVVLGGDEKLFVDSDLTFTEEM